MEDVVSRPNVRDNYSIWQQTHLTQKSSIYIISAAKRSSAYHFATDKSICCGRMTVVVHTDTTHLSLLPHWREPLDHDKSQRHLVSPQLGRLKRRSVAMRRQMHHAIVREHMIEKGTLNWIRVRDGPGWPSPSSVFKSFVLFRHSIKYIFVFAEWQHGFRAGYSDWCVGRISGTHCPSSMRLLCCIYCISIENMWNMFNASKRGLCGRCIYEYTK